MQSYTKPTQAETQFSSLTRRELSCLLYRYQTWRKQLVDGIFERLGSDPTAPISSNQNIVRYCDARIAELELELAGRGRVAA